MSAINDQAIALRRLDYSETSQVLLFLTRAHGPRRLIAKGIKRGTRDRFAVGIDLLERGDVTFIARAGGEGSLGTLTEWRQVTIHAGLRGNLGRLYAAQYAAEITAAMIEEADPHPELYDALCRLLERLAEGGGGSPHSGPSAAGASPTPAGGNGASGRPAGGACLSWLVGYQADLIQAAGLWPDLSRCLLCGRPAPPGRAGYFSAREGGLVCRDCAPRVPEKMKVNGRTLDALRAGPVPPESAPPAFDLLDYTIAHVIGRRPNLSAYVRRHGSI